MRNTRNRTVVGLAVALVLMGCDSGSDTGSDAGAGTSNDADAGPDDDAVGDDADADAGADDGGGGEDPLGAVAAHNAVRAAAQPVPQPPLPDLVWDTQLAAVAQQWADGCVFEHSTNGFGENLYVGTGTPSANDAITAWADEVAEYDYDSNGCSGVCGHYTQIVWRNTTHVGCAFADCPSVAGVSFSGRLWVCNYDPPGNFVGEKPY